MQQQKFSKGGFVRSVVLPALLLFAIPLCGYFFARHATHSYDEQFLDAVTRSVKSDTELPPDRAAEIVTFFQNNKASLLCASGKEGRDALPPEYVSDGCGDQMQFRWMALTALGCIALGVLSIVLVLACVGISFASRNAQYWSFVAGWSFLRIASAAQVIGQGFLAVMLSFWLTAFFFERYSIKLVLLVGFLAAVAVFLVLVAIFKKPQTRLAVEGEQLERAKSPELWARVEALCARIGTGMPDHIVGGIDDNFFVTEHPVILSASSIEGRTLFVSLSLLKRLDKHEADAILAHEMAHFSGGDTLFSKKLAPRLSHFGHYMTALHAGVVSRPVFYFMLFYWSLFQISLGRTQRARELRADKIAAEQTSAASMANALYKVAAYSSYRARVEAGLFERNRAHSQLDIALSVAVGFTEYAASSGLSTDLEAEHAFPHPFDSHPSLGERLANVGVSVAKESVPELVAGTASQTWFNEIGDAERIEGALWDAYEQRFRAAHEESLAYRFLPATPEERAHVERYFPPQRFAGKEGGAFELDCLELRHHEWPAPVSWQAIVGVEAKDVAFRGKLLTIKFRNQAGKNEKLKVALRKLNEPDKHVIEIFNRYYGRAQAAKHFSSQKPSA